MTKEEKKLLIKYLKKHFKRKYPNTWDEELRKYLKDKPLTGCHGIRRKLGYMDLEYFGKAYFPHYFNRKTPRFHRELDDIWKKGVIKVKDGVKRAVAAPRGHAKSTNLTFKDTIHSVVYGYKHYILIISDSSDQADGFLGNIRDEFEDNKLIQEDFGEFKGPVWKNSVLLTKTDIKLEALGAGKKVRGRKHKNWRPDLIVLDDIENDENVRTIEQRKKLANWFYKAVSKAGDDYTDIIYIGTLLHYDSLLAKVLSNPAYKSKKYKAVIQFAKNKDLWDTWENIFIDLSNENRAEEAYSFFIANKDKMLEGTQVLWEDKLDYYDLMVMKVSEGDASFNSEEQNEPINPDDCLFNEEWFDYYNEAAMDFKEDRFTFYGFVDPSLGKSKTSDYSVIITIAKDTETGYMYVIDADIERRHPSNIIEDILEKENWLRITFGRGYTLFGAETNQFQWFLKEELAKTSASKDLYLPIEEVYQTSDKVMRIQTLQPDIKNKYIKLNKRHKLLLEQLKFFPMADHDDGPDALEGCRAIAKGSSDVFFAMASER
ncbi:phage terminase large subunit [Tepidibacter hydrothermalis]|uniref:Phage terminase large subunit n=1 Tax=Tepidibacter hydrothermalis TaxID=3036126 RepID=A0ABY8EHI6_9FIRM|nr:phage terminase large subunit [Tepidibacter hydrothermalis]WFD12422.1 phage terminase large subunit [Tepidibacter hydrothermalis]